MGAKEDKTKTVAPSTSKDSQSSSAHCVKKPLEKTSIPSTYVQTVITLQSLVRGNQSRAKVKVKRLSKGILSVHLHGDSSIFERVGIPGINTLYGHKKISILSLSPSVYSGRVIVGDKCFNAVKASEEDRARYFGPEETVYLNGGFFNLAQSFYPTYEEHAPIGTTNGPGKHPITSIPIPHDYATQYGTLVFSNGSCLSSAPILVKKNQLIFDETLLQLPAYQYESVYRRYPYRYCYPGELYHANHPNPRVAISFPDGAVSEQSSSTKVSTKSDRIRLLITTSPKRGKTSTGFDLSEWSRTLLRISQMNEQPGSALNLDGGGSSVMGLISGGKKIFETSQTKDGVPISTFIAFNKKESDKVSSAIKLSPTIDPKDGPDKKTCTEPKKQTQDETHDKTLTPGSPSIGCELS